MSRIPADAPASAGAFYRGNDMAKIRQKKSRADKGRCGYLFIAPFFIVFLVFGLYPVVYTFALSFAKWDGLTPASSVGFANFKRLIADKVFYLSIWNTFRIWITNFIPQILTALLLSALFTFNQIRGMKFFRAAYYLPNLITAASVGLLFNLLFNGDKSVANYVLLALHVPCAPFNFFNNGPFTSSLVSYIQWWMWFGYTTVIVIAGITTIDSNVYSAAMVDGATKMQTYRKITLPLIRPTLIYITITSIIGGMQLFDVPATLSNGSGDPRKAVLTTSMDLYNQGFKNHNYGYASAVSIGLFVIIALLSVFAFKAMQRNGSAYND
jgi:ABC-type sugar transport system permease subunit